MNIERLMNECYEEAKIIYPKSITVWLGRLNGKSA